FFTTVIHLIKGLVGTGIFALGEAFKFSGYLFGLILICVIALLNLNCQHMLLECAQKIADEEEEEVKPSFAETVEYTMESSTVKWVQNYSKQLGFTTNILVVVSSANGFLTDDTASKHIMLFLILIPMWSTTFLENLKFLLPLTLLANILMWIGIVLIMYFTLKDGITPDGKRYMISDCKSMHRFFGITLFAFESVTFIIPLRNEMRNPAKFTSALGVLNLGMAFVVFVYCSIGFLAYWKYGDDVQGSVFLNLPYSDMYAL
ncbi:Aa trans domain containing protein, partial [Asbolus verrucosus]